MHGRSAPLVPLIVCLAFAGCAGPSTVAPVMESGSSGASPAALPIVDADRGAIAGSVLDDELRPIPSAVVASKGHSSKTSTDAEGLFTMNDLAPGTYELLVDAIGYEAQIRKVEVVAGEILQLEIILVADAVVVPYVLPILRTFYIDLDQYYLSPVLNGTAHVDTCPQCEGHLRADPKPVQVQNEGSWAATGVPAYNNGVQLSFRWKPDGFAGGLVTNQQKKDWEPSYLNRLRDAMATDLTMRVQSPALSVSLQQRIDMWTTFAYVEKLPEDYSAFPK